MLPVNRPFSASGNGACATSAVVGSLDVTGNLSTTRYGRQGTLFNVLCSGSLPVVLSVLIVNPATGGLPVEVYARTALDGTLGGSAFDAGAPSTAAMWVLAGAATGPASAVPFDVQLSVPLLIPSGGTLGLYVTAAPSAGASALVCAPALQP